MAKVWIDDNGSNRIEINGLTWSILEGSKAWVCSYGRYTYYGKTRQEAIEKGAKRNLD